MYLRNILGLIGFVSIVNHYKPLPYPNHFRTYHIKHAFTTRTAPLAGGIATYIHTKHHIYENKNIQNKMIFIIKGLKILDKLNIIMKDT